MSWALIPLTEEQREIQRTARDFGQAEIAPYSGAWDRAEKYDEAIVGKLGELGFLGMLIPEEFDGLGLDTRTYVVALEEIAAVDASVAVLMSVHNSLPTQMILRYGNAAQKERFLKPMARGEWLGAFALSEPEAGSDAAALRTQAHRDGDCWVLNGTKAWVTSGNHANVILAMARTDSPNDRRGPRGIGTFIVTPDMPGFHVGKKEAKAGIAIGRVKDDGNGCPAMNASARKGNFARKRGLTRPDKSLHGPHWPPNRLLSSPDSGYDPRAPLDLRAFDLFVSFWAS